MVIKDKESVSVLLVGGFGHAVCVFDEWLRDGANVHLTGAVQTLPDEGLEGFLAHPWSQKFSPTIYQDLKHALSREKPDLVVVSTRPDLNPDLIEMCLRADCHVIAEKPLAVDEAGLLRLHQAVKETGRFVLPMLGMHDLPAFVEAQELVTRGVIGEPILVNARKSYKWGQRPEFFKQRETFGGIWGWVGIHSFNAAFHILKRNLIKVLAAQEQNRFHPEFAPGCSDCLSGLFLLEGDVQMTVSIDLLRPEKECSWGDDWIRIVGSEGSLEANAAQGTIRLIHKAQNETRHEVTAVAPPFYTLFLSAVESKVDFSELTTLGFQLTESGLTANRASIGRLNNLELNHERWKL
jgi:predicted dehydrogenase